MNMPPSIDLLELGSTITDVFAFLAPAYQHKLRCTSSGMCQWFDSAAENGSLAFFVTFSPHVAAAHPLRWKHATSEPKSAVQKSDNSCSDEVLVTVTVHTKNYYLSTFNWARDETVIANEKEGALIDKAIILLPDEFPFEHKLVISGLFGFRSIGDGFCCGMKAKEIQFKGDTDQLLSVGNFWLSDCPNLKSVTFAGFPALEKLGNSWMSDCPNLESVAFARELPKLRKVGYRWMGGCPKVSDVDFEMLTVLEEVGGCSSLSDYLRSRFARYVSYWVSVGLLGDE